MNDDGSGADSIDFSHLSELAERQGFGPILRTIVTDHQFRSLVQADAERSELLARTAAAVRRVAAPLSETEWDDRDAFTCCWEPIECGGFRRTCRDADCRHRHHRFEHVTG